MLVRSYPQGRKTHRNENLQSLSEGMWSSDPKQKTQELMKDFFLVSSVFVLAIVSSLPLWFIFVVPPARPFITSHCVTYGRPAVHADGLSDIDTCATEILMNYAFIGNISW